LGVAPESRTTTTGSSGPAGAGASGVERGERGSRSAFGLVRRGVFYLLLAAAAVTVAFLRELLPLIVPGWTPAVGGTRDPPAPRDGHRRRRRDGPARAVRPGVPPDRPHPRDVGCARHRDGRHRRHPRVRPPRGTGRRRLALAAWIAAVGPLYHGLLSVAFPARAGVGPTWGVAAIVRALAFVLVGEYSRTVGASATFGREVVRASRGSPTRPYPYSLHPVPLREVAHVALLTDDEVLHHDEEADGARDDEQNADGREYHVTEDDEDDSGEDRYQDGQTDHGRGRLPIHVSVFARMTKTLVTVGFAGSTPSQGGAFDNAGDGDSFRRETTRTSQGSTTPQTVARRDYPNLVSLIRRW